MNNSSGYKAQAVNVKRSRKYNYGAAQIVKYYIVLVIVCLCSSKNVILPLHDGLIETTTSKHVYDFYIENERLVLLCDV